MHAYGGPEIVEAIRALIERVEVHPPGEVGTGPWIELQGHLASLLRLAGACGSENAKSPAGVPDGLMTFFSSELGDAGTRNRRCQYITISI